MPPQASPPGGWPGPATPADPAGRALDPPGDGATQSTPDRPLTGLIAVRPASPDLLRRLASGTGQRPLDWHPDYPTTETVTAAAMTVEALAAAGTADGDPAGERRLAELGTAWGLFQIVVDGQVVGDAGFHGPPTEESPRVVEIGYSVVAARRGRGIATAACRLLLDRAWVGGAEQVLAETEPENLASRRVLRRNGFRPVPPERGDESGAGSYPLRFAASAPGRGSR